jgi:hypothetical protein
MMISIAPTAPPGAPSVHPAQHPGASSRAARPAAVALAAKPGVKVPGSDTVDCLFGCVDWYLYPVAAGVISGAASPA